MKKKHKFPGPPTIHHSLFTTHCPKSIQAEIDSTRTPLLIR